MFLATEGKACRTFGYIDHVDLLAFSIKYKNVTRCYVYISICVSCETSFAFFGKKLPIGEGTVRKNGECPCLLSEFIGDIKWLICRSDSEPVGPGQVYR